MSAIFTGGYRGEILVLPERRKSHGRIQRKKGYWHGAGRIPVRIN